MLFLVWALGKKIYKLLEKLWEFLKYSKLFYDRESLTIIIKWQSWQ